LHPERWSAQAPPVIFNGKSRGFFSGIWRRDGERELGAGDPEGERRT
jgi:hypothetical protein